MPVSVTEKASTSAARFSSSLSGLQPAVAGSMVSVTWPLVRELEGVGQQVLDDLLQALGVGEHRLRQARVELRSRKSRFFDSATWRKVRST